MVINLCHSTHHCPLMQLKFAHSLQMDGSYKHTTPAVHYKYQIYPQYGKH